MFTTNQVLFFTLHNASFAFLPLFEKLEVGSFPSKVWRTSSRDSHKIRILFLNILPCNGRHECHCWPASQLLLHMLVSQKCVLQRPLALVLILSCLPIVRITDGQNAWKVSKAGLKLAMLGLCSRAWQIVSIPGQIYCHWNRQTFGPESFKSLGMLQESCTSRKLWCILWAKKVSQTKWSTNLPFMFLVYRRQHIWEAWMPIISIGQQRIWKLIPSFANNKYSYSS